MIITNKYNLPESLLKAITWDLKPRTGFSVTELINSPRVVQLTRRHWDEIEEDISERIWLLLGTAVHYILEKGELPDSLKEERLETEIYGIRVSGKPDLWRNNTISDYKVTSVWSIIYEPNGRTDWHSQLNLYRYLYWSNGFDTDKLEICAILRDWQERKVGENGYPKIPIAMIDIPIWSLLTTGEYLDNRVKAHLKATALSDDMLPECTPEEMWTKDTKYAIKKDGRKTALAVLDTLEETTTRLTEGCYIEKRLGENVRCERYCPARNWCNQYKESK